MHGIPFALKDIYCTAGIRTTSHSRTRADYIPDFDATTVAKLHQAGAILLGKLATHEFAHGGPSPSTCLAARAQSVVPRACRTDRPAALAPASRRG